MIIGVLTLPLRGRVHDLYLEDGQCAAHAFRAFFRELCGIFWCADEAMTGPNNEIAKGNGSIGCCLHQLGR